MTLKELEARLRSSGIADFKEEARILACRVCGISLSRLVFFREELPCSDKLCDAVSRRAAGEPLQYIVGTWDFMNETYEVTPDVLIPRQDTEILVEWAIKNLPHGSRFADLGTGSGCIAVSTLAARKDLTCVAVDVSPEALAVAKRNAERNGVSGRVEFRLFDILRGRVQNEEFDAILSNPPYVSLDEY